MLCSPIVYCMKYNPFDLDPLKIEGLTEDVVHCTDGKAH